MFTSGAPTAHETCVINICIYSSVLVRVAMALDNAMSAVVIAMATLRVTACVHTCPAPLTLTSVSSRAVATGGPGSGHRYGGNYRQ